MQEVIVDIVDLKIFHGVVVHFDGFLPRLCGRVKIGQFGGHEIFIARIFMKRDTCRLLRMPHAVSRRCVKIIHTMLNGIVHQFIDHFLIDLRLFIFLLWFVGQSHHAIAQQ